MRPRLIRLLVIVLVPAGWLPLLAGPASAATRLTKITGIPRTFVQASSLHYSLSLRTAGSRALTLTTFLVGNGSTVRTKPERVHANAAGRTTLAVDAAIPGGLGGGRYRLIVCAANKSLRKLPSRGCLSSSTFSLIPAVRIATGQGTTARPALDVSRGVGATIGSGGGSLTATTADGSTVTLTIPPGALAGAEQVTMVPITGLAGSSLKLAAGVQIGPGGLRLQQPATLSLASATSVPLSHQIGFAYQGSGGQLGLLPLLPGRATKLSLLRLGGAGLASATSSQAAQRLGHAPREAFAAFVSQLAAPLRQLRLAGLHQHPTGTPHPVTTIKGELGGFFNQFVEPSLRRSSASLGGFLTATQRTLAWERQTRLAGYPRLFAGQQQRTVTTDLGQALATIWGHRTAMCDRHKTVGNLQAVMTIGHAAESLRLGRGIGGPTAIDSAILSCAQITGQASLLVPSTGWNSGDLHNQLSQIVSTVATNGAISFTGIAGDNRFSFQSPNVAVTEQVLSAAASAQEQAAGCTPPIFVSYTSDPTQMYAVFSGILTVPDDLFDVPTPPWSYDYRVAGADMATWSISCPPTNIATSFTQSPQAMASLAAITGLTPVRLTAQKTSRSFAGQADLVSGTTITGLASGRGTAGVSLP